MVDTRINGNKTPRLIKLKTILQELVYVVTAIIALATATNDVIEVVGILGVGTYLQTICAAEGVV